MYPHTTRQNTSQSSRNALSLKRKRPCQEACTQSFEFGSKIIFSKTRLRNEWMTHQVLKPHASWYCLQTLFFNSYNLEIHHKVWKTYEFLLMYLAAYSQAYKCNPWNVPNLFFYSFWFVSRIKSRKLNTSQDKNKCRLIANFHYLHFNYLIYG